MGGTRSPVSMVCKWAVWAAALRVVPDPMREREVFRRGVGVGVKVEDCTWRGDVFLRSR